MRGSILVIVSFACFACAVMVWQGTRTKTCGSYRISKDAQCHREGQQLERVSNVCRHVLDHPDLRDTPWVRRIQRRWDGTIHQLIDSGPAPAVTTHKSDIRMCLDNASSHDAQVFVCLHELAHMGVDSYGHTPEFWACFRAFIRAAEAAGVYTHNDEAQVCGTKLGGVPGEK